MSAGVLPRRTTCFGVASEMGTGYATLWNTFKRITAGCSHTEKLALYSGTAVACGFTPFLGFSYGFRPKLSQHDALDALIVGISSRKVNFILDADIRSFFTEVFPAMGYPLPGAPSRSPRRTILRPRVAGS